MEVVDGSRGDINNGLELNRKGYGKDFECIYFYTVQNQALTSSAIYPMLAFQSGLRSAILYPR